MRLLGSGSPLIISATAWTSIVAPDIVVTNGMFNSTANLLIMFPSRTAPPELVGVLMINWIERILRQGGDYNVLFTSYGPTVGT